MVFQTWFILKTWQVFKTILGTKIGGSHKKWKPPNIFNFCPELNIQVLCLFWFKVKLMNFQILDSISVD
jgi:hypothetical protein